uniref:RNA-directed DNA polymerase, eukaryota, reverse transcriptase zinc-binding domain protein n=1 Tax=Tanacetum cinerariifolium TaxID=118510 RepID=A0A699H9S3_TANCI|nr:RNA-directed DNA polymerase, eukaryota, reverse transcriptase zinc-binding domain protein [Tanacetum cinerariifolium]
MCTALNTNLIYHQRFGSIFSSEDAAVFNDFIHDTGLIDLPMGGINFTWMNKVGSKMSKFDHFPISNDVIQDILNLQAIITSEDLEFSRPLHTKLKDLKSHLKLWYSHTKETESSRKASLLANLRDLEKKMDDGHATDDEKATRINKLQELGNLENLESMDLVQKRFVVNFFSTCMFPQGANSAFVTLIPKVSNPLFIKDYCPISLIGVNYKIIAKILANRLSKVIDSIISSEQFAFILGCWRYLDYILDKLAFGIRWRNWIKNILMSARTSILINGSPSSEFSLKRGLRQEDPLSPFLFIIVMEGLHLNQSDMENIIWILNVFYISSGLKINIHKSNVFGVGVSSSEIVSMAAYIGCEAAITDRFKARLSRWKANMLSIGGRMTLIKFVLRSLGIYYLSIFKAPESVVNTLESMCAAFLWGSSENSKKLAWVKWSNILASLDKGGLGVGSLSAFNKALLLKWRWCLFQNPFAFWVYVIKSIHGEEASIDLRGCQMNRVWASIVGTINHLHSSGIVPLSFIRFRVGDGSSIRFWKDTWLGNGPFCTGRTKADFDKLILDIANLDEDKMAKLDSCIWSLSHDGIFLVNMVRKVIHDLSLPTLSPSTRWYTMIPKKTSIRFLVWSVMGMLNRMLISSSNVTWLWLFGILFVCGLVLLSPSFARVKNGILVSIFMGSQRSKEDEVRKISTSVFVNNFPDQYGAKDMWNSCKIYGHVVDAYIPNRISNAGKRFGFVRFVKVDDVERLVNNLCTVKRGNEGVGNNVNGKKDASNSYAHVVKGTQLSKEDTDNNPSLVLDDPCLNQKDYSLCLMGKVKDIVSLSNLKVVLVNEGFMNIEIKYMGGFWVMIEFQLEVAKKSFQSNLGMEIEGVPFKLLHGNTFSRIASRCGDLLDGDDQEDGCYHRKRICIRWVLDFVEDKEEDNGSDDGSYKGELNVGGLKNAVGLEGDSDVEDVPESKFKVAPNNPTLEEVSVGQNNLQFEDPFGIYDILNKKRDANNKDSILGDSLKYPPSFTPRDDKDASVAVPYDNYEKTRECDGQEDGFSGEVVIMGDFNEVHTKCERFGFVINRQGADAFNSFISNAGLEEVPLGGCSFTWCHNSATKMRKLDRFLISNSLMCFDKLVEDSWKEAHVTDPNAFLKMMKKLRYLKEKIRMWSRLNKESLNSRKRCLKAELVDFDWIINKGDGEATDVNRRFDVVRLLQEVKKIESLEVAQKAKIKWVIDGDENSKYYHCPQENRLRMEMNFPNRINFDQKEDLEREVSKEEIKKAVWDCGIDKAPGPGGFTFGFYRRYWNLIESDVVDGVACFFNQGQLPKGGNSSFIALIPKFPNANMVKDFRPISLIGSLYKIIANILVNRLVMVLGDLVNEIQSVFMVDRQIFDGPFILNELVQWCKKKKKQAMVFKVDFEKAYDSVRWDFVDDILNKFGFREKWCRKLTCFVSKSGGRKFVQRNRVGSFASSFSLFYADDAIFMGQWSESNIDNIVHVLECFHCASGLCINMDKSKLMGISVDVVKVEQVAAKIGCVTLKTHFTYLGACVGGLMSRLQS